MNFQINRRSLLLSGAGLALSGAWSGAAAAGKVELIFSDTVSEQDPRAKFLAEVFAKGLGDDFNFKPYYNATLFKQGTEVTAMQRGNLDMANLAAFDIQKQIPAWGVTTIAYGFHDPDHMKAVFASDIGKELFKMVEDQLGIKILSVPYIGTRQLGLKGKKKIMTPADLAGVKLRMPAGDAWQFLGKVLGANPVPMAFTEVYTGLQSGAIDGQDNPLGGIKVMKFYEVIDQIVLTGHLVANNMFSIRKAKWDSLTPDQQKVVQTSATAFADAVTAQSKKDESELVDYFKAQGLEVYTPDVKAFRARALKMYRESPYAKDWIPGMIDRMDKL
jgi:TRAP-type transport system periplasmic protein